MQVFIKLSKLILLAAVLAGCSKTDGEDRSVYKYDNYVGCYIKPVHLFGTIHYNSTSGTGGPSLAEQEYNRFWMEMRFYPAYSYESYGEERKQFSQKEVDQYRLDHFICRSLKSTDDVIYDQPYNPEFNRIYDSLCTVHRDTQYQEKYKYATAQFSFPAVFRKMTLDVVSDAPYDAAHPAGASLADIISLHFPTAKEFIESGYQSAEPTKNLYYVKNGDMVLIEPLNQFNTEYRKLVGGSFRFEFTKAPDATSTHRFTIVYRDEDGRVLTSQMAPVTIQDGK